MPRYVIYTAEKKTIVGFFEIFTGVFGDSYPIERRAEAEAICDNLNREDDQRIAEWEQLDRLDLDTDPFVMGRQARCIGAGCPYRPSSDRYARFWEGFRLQDDLYRDRPPHPSLEFLKDRYKGLQGKTVLF